MMQSILEYNYTNIHIFFIPKYYCLLYLVINMVETIGDRIKRLRKMHNFTQEQVANYLGFKQTHIAKLESNNRKLKSSSLNKLCELYNCPKEYILTGIGEYSNEEFKFRSSKDLDLETLANMNRIIRNIKELTELNGD